MRWNKGLEMVKMELEDATDRHTAALTLLSIRFGQKRRLSPRLTYQRLAVTAGRQAFQAEHIGALEDADSLKRIAYAAFWAKQDN